MFCKHVTLYFILSGTDAARIYILGLAILYQEILMALARSKMPPAPFWCVCRDVLPKRYHLLIWILVVTYCKTPLLRVCCSYDVIWRPRKVSPWAPQATSQAALYMHLGMHASYCRSHEQTLSNKTYTRRTVI